MRQEKLRVNIKTINFLHFLVPFAFATITYSTTTAVIPSVAPLSSNTPQEVYYPVSQGSFLTPKPLGQLGQGFSTTTLIRDLFGENAPFMERIFYCESRNRQFGSDGKPLHSTTDDWGYTQISAPTWDKKAKELGLDYKYSIEDNIKMAKYVYNQSGIRAWSCYNVIINS